jgi:uncharacterized OsmC-like protein
MASCGSRKTVFPVEKPPREMAEPLDEKQRRRLLALAEMRPVHRTLKAEMLVENSLVG